MTLFKFSDAENKQYWIEQIRAQKWGAAEFLAYILEQNKVDEILGGGEIFILADGERLVSFCTLTKNDCVKDDTLFPWIGFLFTTPEYRGHRYSEIIMDEAYRVAKEQGADKVYLATDHIGFYEKYGYTYLETRIDIYDEESRIYYK